MKRLRILSVLLSASLVMTAAAGCKKEESEEPVLIYYSEGQQEPSAVTFAPEEAPAQTNEPEVLAPIIADRSEPSASATVTVMETEESETSRPAETEESASTTAASETSATTAAADQGGTPNVPVVSSGTHVHDDAGVITNEGSLDSAMASFESDTGISPAIFTISNQLSGDEFRQYARDIYSSNFDDQDHVLIVYQLTPAGTWSWTCVFGSNTGTVFTQDHINEFQSNLTSAFSSGNVDNALVSTFNAAENYN